MKLSRYHKVVSCSGITDPDLPDQNKCPFYSENNYDCCLSGDNVENDMIVPEDCLLRKFDIEVVTEVLNQQEMDYEK